MVILLPAVLLPALRLHAASEHAELVADASADASDVSFAFVAVASQLGFGGSVFLPVGGHART